MSNSAYDRNFAIGASGGTVATTGKSAQERQAIDKAVTDGQASTRK